MIPLCTLFGVGEFFGFRSYILLHGRLYDNTVNRRMALPKFYGVVCVIQGSSNAITVLLSLTQVSETSDEAIQIPAPVLLKWHRIDSLFIRRFGTWARQLHHIRSVCGQAEAFPVRQNPCCTRHSVCVRAQREASPPPNM